MDRQTDRRIHNLHTKQITPLPYMGTGGIFLYPIFSTSLKMVLAHSILFGLIFEEDQYHLLSVAIALRYIGIVKCG